MKTYCLIITIFCFFVSSAQQQTIETSKGAQEKLNKEYADPKESPLEEEDLKQFKGLDFYPIDEKYIVKAQFIRTEKEKTFQMKTTGTRLRVYVKYGEVVFKLEGKTFRLNVYQSIDLTKTKGFEDYLFLPFSDLTCGEESYLGGRYIDMRIPNSKEISIDFNKAYNPYCAYNHKYSCPLVPLENNLKIEVKAGVKKFHD